jgi:hypothetical protein
LSLCKEIGIITAKSVQISSRKRTSMPNRYEREIEEILRNLERTDPGVSSGRKSRVRERRSSGVRWNMSAIRLSFSEWCLVLACLAAVGAGGWAYAQHLGEGTLVTGVIALLGAACILIAVLSAFVTSRVPSAKTRGNVTRLRRNPLSRLSTNWHLFLLKLRYRRQRERERGN